MKLKSIHIYRLYLLAILSLIITLNKSFGQLPGPELNLDSLIVADQKYAKQDLVKLKLLVQLCRSYNNRNPTKGVETANQAIALVQKISGQNNGFYLAAAYHYKGVNLYNLKQDSLALAFYNKALTINTSLKNTFGIGYNKLNIGTYYRGKSQYELAFKTYENAIQLFENANIKIGKASAFFQIAKVYSKQQNFEKAIDYNNKSYQLFKSIGEFDLAGKAMANVGVCYFRLYDSQKALESYKMALEMHEKVNALDGIADDLGKIAAAYFGLDNIKFSIEYLLKALALSEKIGIGNNIENDRSTCITLTNLANCYGKLENHSKAVEYNLKALKISEKHTNKEDIAKFLGDLGYNYVEIGNKTKALEYLNKAIEMNSQNGFEENLVHNYEGIVRLYWGQLNDKLTAYNYIQKSLSLQQKLGNKMFMEEYSSLIHLGAILREIPDSLCNKIGIKANEKFEKSFSNLDKAFDIAKKINCNSCLTLYYEAMSRNYEKQKNFEKAYEYYKQLIDLRDSVNIEETKKQITRKEVEYEFSKKETEYQFQQSLSNEKIKQAKLLSEQQLLALNLKQKDLTISNKQKEIEHLAYLKTQAELQNEHVKLTEKEKIMSLLALEKEQEKLTAEQKIKDEKTKTTIITLSSALLLLLLGVIVFVIYNRNKIRQLKEIIAVRNTISNNLHDDVGSALSSISIISNMSKNVIKNNPEKAGELLEKISDTTSEIMGSMKDIIWSINPNNDKLENLIIRMREFAADMLENNKIGLLFTDHSDSKSLEKMEKNRHDIYLIFKEAINNITKYSNASLVKINIENENNKLVLVISDNGEGFNMSEVTFGNGLLSMKNRAKKINGNLKIISEKGIGTKITLIV